MHSLRLPQTLIPGNLAKISALLLCMGVIILSLVFSPVSVRAQSNAGSNQTPAAAAESDTPGTEELEQVKRDLNKAIKDKTNIDLENQTPEEILEQVLGQIPRFIPAIIALICIIPLLWGWKIVRYVFTFFFAFFFGSMAFVIVSQARPDQPWVAIIIAIIASSLGSVLGWYSVKFGTALIGALLIGNVMALIGLMFGNEILAMILAVFGLVIGLVLGWKSAHYFQALLTSFVAALIMGICTYVVLYERSPTLGILAAAIVFIVGSLLGCFVQLKSVNESESGMIGTATTAETKKKVEKAMKKKKTA